MNYGVIALGASLVIVHFLRLVGAMGGSVVDRSTTSSRRIQELIQQEYLKNVVTGVTDETVLGWLLGDHMLKRRSVLERVWNSTSQLVKTTFYQRHQSNRVNSDYNSNSNVNVNVEFDRNQYELELLELEEDAEILDSISNNNNNNSVNYEAFLSRRYEEYRRRSREQRKKYCKSKLNITACLLPSEEDEYHESPSNNNSTDLNIGDNNNTVVNDLEIAGCRYIVAAKILVCDNPNLTSLPLLPNDLELFELNDTQVQALGKNAFGQSRIATVKIHANSLSCIHPMAFQGLSGLKVLSISNNALSYIRLGDFKTLNETYIIYMEHNDIDLSYNPYDDDEDDDNVDYESDDTIDTNLSVRDDELEPALPKLIYFSLMGNPIKIIPPRFFFPLRYSPLKTLILMCCQLKFIHPETFSYLPQLAHLDLSENPDLMPSLVYAFSGLNSTISLIELSLANNNLAQVPTAALAQIPTLEILDLNGNLFDSLRRDSFPSPQMNKLKSLNLDNCRIRSIGLLTFKEMTNLESLVLTNNRLSTIPPALIYLKKLSVLDLSSNVPAEISTVNTIKPTFTIQPYVLYNLPKLKALTLSHLPMTRIDRYIFKGLLNLEVLLMSDTNIKSIADDAFEDLVKLNALDLSYGELTEVNTRTFTGVGNLTVLRLDYNQIEIPGVSGADSCYADPGSGLFNESSNDDSITSKTNPFKNLQKLERLLLNNNKIRHLHNTLFQDLSKLTHLDLSENLIHSWEERVFSNNSQLRELLVSKNTLGPISTAMLEDFLAKKTGVSATEILDISNNPFVCDKVSCQLAKLASNKSLKLEKWSEKSSHTCFDTQLKKYINMISLLSISQLCLEDVEVPTTTASTTTSSTSVKPEPEPEPATDSTSSPTTIKTTMTTNAASISSSSSSSTSSSTTPSSSTSSTTSNSNFPPTPVTDKSSTGDQYNNTDIVKSSSSVLATFAIVFTCILFLSSATVIGYKKRFHLKYFLFVVRFNVVNIPNLNLGKKRASLTSYEYDIFISYNHTDRVFIEDYLMPNVESFPNPHIDLINSSNNNNISNNNRYNKNIDMNNYGEYRERKDIDIEDDVESVKSTSSNNSLRVCIHERDFKAGVPISDNIVDFVDKSRKVVVVVSKNYLISQWCLFEMNLAYHRLIESGRKSFVVILLEDIPASLRTKSLNYLLLSRTYLEWPGMKASEAEQSTFWKRLRNSLSSIS